LVDLQSASLTDRSEIAVKLLRLCHVVGNIFATAIDVNPVSGLRPDRRGAAIRAI
jgi:hypothetical protein